MTLQGYSASDTLTDDAGRAQKGKTLTVTGPGSYVGTVVSDTETGIFRLGPLPIGVYTVFYGDRSAQVPVYPTPADMQAAYDAAAAAATLTHTDAADAALAAADAAEASARAAADTAAAAAATAATAAEAATRAAADSADATDDAAEVSARQAADAAEASARVAADSAESAARAALDAREAANNAAQASAITDEATARASAITAEASARIAADNALQASVAANTSAIALKLSTSVAAGTYSSLAAEIQLPQVRLYNVTIDVNGNESAGSFRWSDGEVGVYALLATDATLEPSSWSVTKPSLSKTFTQPVMTFDASGNVVTRPAVTIA